VTLFIGNLTEEWQDEERLKKDLSEHGRIERAFIAYNALGQSKVSPMIPGWKHPELSALSALRLRPYTTSNA